MNEEKFVLVKGAAGLGNRILCLLSAMLYAEITERRLIVDWKDPFYSDDGTNVFHSYFQTPLCSLGDVIPSTKSVRPGVWKGHLDKPARNLVQRHRSNFPDPEIWRRLSVDVSNKNYEEKLLVMWSYTEQIYLMRKHFTGKYVEFKNKDTKQILSDLMKENLKLHPRIAKRVDEFKRTKFNGKTVGVHVRYSDKKARLTRIKKELNSLLNKEPELQIFLATDNAEIYKMFQNEYTHVLSTDKWYPSPGENMHRNPKSPNRLEHGEEALIDMYLLADCDYLIIDESSSFSYVASLITETSNSNIINVQFGKILPEWLRRLLWQIMIKFKKTSLKLFNRTCSPTF